MIQKLLTGSRCHNYRNDMPIRPENRSRYPKDWKRIRASILERANNRCEFCGVENYTMRVNPKTGKAVKIILTIAHLDHTPENCDPDNLRALCQKCHNAYDAEHRKQTRQQTKSNRQATPADYDNIPQVPTPHCSQCAHYDYLGNNTMYCYKL